MYDIQEIARRIDILIPIITDIKENTTFINMRKTEEIYRQIDWFSLSKVIEYLEVVRDKIKDNKHYKKDISLALKYFDEVFKSDHTYSDPDNKASRCVLAVYNDLLSIYHISPYIKCRFSAINEFFADRLYQF